MKLKKEVHNEGKDEERDHNEDEDEERRPRRR
jgi:hypothetical protein